LLARKEPSYTNTLGYQVFLGMNTERILKFIKNRKFLTILGSLLLAVVGNGLWEYIVKPSLSILRDIFLNIATLGISNFKDDCYQLIARGFSESASLSLFSELNAIYISICILFTLYLFEKISEGNKKLRELDVLITKPSEAQESKPSIEERLRKITRLMTKAKLLAWSCVVIIVFIVSMKVLSIVKLNYVNSAITHYRQMISICRPYISEKEAQIIDSKFSQISNKEDYASLMLELYQICEKNKIKHQTFLPW
jgi:hypothetical protein